MAVQIKSADFVASIDGLLNNFSTGFASTAKNDNCFHKLIITNCLCLCLV